MESSVFVVVGLKEFWSRIISQCVTVRIEVFVII